MALQVLPWIMPTNPALTFGLCAIVCALVFPLSAQLVTITAEGQLEHLQNPASAPPVVQQGPRAIVSLVLDSSQEPISTDQQTATYRPISATLLVGRETYPLTNAVFVVERFSQGRLSSGFAYLIRGTTPLGWLFSLRSGSTSPTYAPDFSIPTEMPIGELDFAHDVTLRDEAFGWGAYGDGALLSVSSTTDAASGGG